MRKVRLPAGRHDVCGCHEQERESNRNSNGGKSRKGLSDYVILPGFLIVAIIGLMIFSYFYWNKLGYSKKLLARTAAERVARSINLVSTYHGRGSLEMSFRVPYRFKVTDDYVVASYGGNSATSYFFTSYQVQTRPPDKTKIVNVTKRDKRLIVRYGQE